MGRSYYVLGQSCARENEILKGRAALAIPVYSGDSASATITASGTPHSLGTWQQVIAATAADADWLLYQVTGMGTSATDTRGLVSIATGANPNEAAIISDIPAGYSTTNYVTTPSLIFKFPVRIPKGTRITAALRSLIASDTAVVTVTLFANPNPGQRSPAKLVTIGATSSASRGTNLPSSGTYTEITAATPMPFQGLVMCPCGGVIGAGFAALTSIYTLGMGAGGAEVALQAIATRAESTEFIGRINSNASSFAWWTATPYVGHIPGGSRLAVKPATGAGYLDVILFGIPYS